MQVCGRGCVAKMVCNQDVCERWCATKMWVKDGVSQRCVWKMVCDNAEVTLEETLKKP